MNDEAAGASSMLGLSMHHKRFKLHSELHAGAAEFLEAPTQISNIAVLLDSDQAERERTLITQLCERFGAAAPGEHAAHFSADMGIFRFNWERHTDYSTYSFYHCAPFDKPFDDPAINRVPKDWLAQLPGEVISATHIALENKSKPMRTLQELSVLFASNTISGAEVAAGAAVACTDNQIHADGFSRILIHDVNLRPRQAGRLVKRLLDIEIYRILAMLPVPTMRAHIPQLADFDERLADLIETHHTLSGVEDEQKLVEELTQLAAEIERILSRTSQRFNASSMYYEIVKLRISELREKRIQGLQMFREFMEQRLSSAMGTCQLVNSKLETLSTRVQRASSLLSTRVEISMEKQSRDLLKSMDKRAHLQLRLQETVEGLSIVVLSYYLLGLTGYGFKALKAAGLGINAELATGLAIPIVVAIVYMILRRIKQSVHQALH